MTEHFQLGRFGQVVLSSGGRLMQPTNIYAPGSDADALQAANNLNRIIIDDASQPQNPDPIRFGRGGPPLSASNTLRGGDTATGIVGVLNYTWAGNSPAECLSHPADQRAERICQLRRGQPAADRCAAACRTPACGGHEPAQLLQQLQRLHLGVGGGATDCRGAETQTEFDRQWPKTVAPSWARTPMWSASSNRKRWLRAG